MDDIKAKQQIVEKIQASSNILVTVSDSPSVDALSAAIGFTLLLDKMEKHATSVFSGTVPPAIAFLEPEKILDDTTDSLRDFIIALDKEKADHLRYKVEGDSVKIFITPYKTTITSDDLDFSQGDYNVELVIALGVDDQDHLDGALASHGQILHDATVVTMTAGEQTSTLGGIDWHDDQASSLSEMVAGLSEAFKTDKKKSLLDAQTATALLTGIVAQTDRFSNEHTTAKVMTMASQLMAAGADQQLIATKLSEGTHQVDDHHDDETSEKATQSSDGGLSISRDKSSDSSEESTPNKDKSSLDIHHKEFETLEEMDKRVKAAGQTEATKAANDALDHTANAVPAGRYAPEEEDATLAPEQPETSDDSQPQDDSPKPRDEHVDRGITALPDDGAPGLGGSLNATTEQAADDARKAAENDQNKTILSHNYMQSQPSYNAEISAVDSTNPSPSASNSFVIGNGSGTLGSQADSGLPAPEPLHPVSASATPPSPQDLGLPMPPPLPGETAAPITPPTLEGPYAPPAEPTQQPERLGDILAPEPSAPSTPTIPAATPEPTQPSSPQVPPTDPTVPPVAPTQTPEGPYAPPANDPGQFKIPGQPGQ